MKSTKKDRKIDSEVETEGNRAASCWGACQHLLWRSLMKEVKPTAQHFESTVKIKAFIGPEKRISKGDLHWH